MAVLDALTRRRWRCLGWRPGADGGVSGGDPSKMAARGAVRRGRLSGASATICDGSAVPARPSATAQRSRRDHLRRVGGPDATICAGSAENSLAGEAREGLGEDGAEGGL